MSNTKMEPQHSLPASHPRPTHTRSLYEELLTVQDPHRLSTVTTQFFAYLARLQGVDFQSGLQLALKVVPKGYFNLLVGTDELLKKVKGHFVQLTKLFEIHPSMDLQYRRFFTLSVLAQFLRLQNKIQLPFDQKFLRALFDIEVEQAPKQSQSQLLAILGVIYCNLVSRPLVLKELKMAKMLKESILRNYHLAQQLFTLKLLNQCIMQLQMKKLAVFTICELQRYGIKQRLATTLPQRQAQMLDQYIEKMFPRSKDLGKKSST